MNAAQFEEALKERARQLAQRPEEADAHGLPLTLFARAGLLLAARVEEVAGAGALRQLTPVPGAPPFICGAVLHRGEVLALLDLPALWGLPVQGIADLPTYVVLTDGQGRIGIPVEELKGVQELPEAPSPWTGAPHAGVAEVAQVQEQAAWVLRARDLFGDPRLSG